MQRIQRHQGNRCGAIWIGDDAVMLLNVCAIYFRNHERHIRLHPEDGGIVDHDSAGVARKRNKSPRVSPPALKNAISIPLNEVSDSSSTATISPLEIHGPSSRTGRSESANLRDRKRAPLQNAQ